jgi:hypothetical protein
VPVLTIGGCHSDTEAPSYETQKTKSRMEIDPESWADRIVFGGTSGVYDELPFYYCNNPNCRACSAITNNNNANPPDNCDCPRSPSGTVYHKTTCSYYTATDNDTD